MRFSETAVFWFGRVTPSENALDVRVGYNDEHLFLHVAVLSLICSRKHVVGWGAFWGGTFVGTQAPSIQVLYLATHGRAWSVNAARHNYAAC